LSRARESLLISTTIYRNRSESLSRRELDAKLTKANDPVDRYKVTRFRATVAKSIEGGDPSTK
jgi:hypothetical protein